MPENTVAAIREAIEVGADMAEIDVTLTADGQVVCARDDGAWTVTPMPGGGSHVVYELAYNVNSKYQVAVSIADQNDADEEVSVTVRYNF